MGKIAAVNWVAVLYGLIITTFLVVSCKGTGVVLPNPVQPIEHAITTTTDVQKGMSVVADDIDSHVTAVRTKTPEPLLPVFGPHLDGLSGDADTIRELKGKLDGVNSELEGAKTDVKTLQSDNVKKDQSIKKLEDEKKSALRNLMVWVIVLSVVGVGISGALVYTGKMQGIALGFGCLITLGLAVLITQYAMWFAIGAGGLCLLGAGYVAYELVSRKKIAVELAHTNEVAKMAIKEPARLYLFGNGPIPGKVDHIQSPKTKKFVNQVRSKPTFQKAPSVKPVLLDGAGSAH